MVFQDGIQYKAPVVFDNLINRKEMPVTIGVFVMHGRVKALSDSTLDRFNRSYEYDGLGDNYARFLIEELLPEVTKKYNISTNADDHAIAGASSGAIAAFTAAWERPDMFHRVFSSIGTYVGLRGGNNYPTLIRKSEPKPIRIFLQDGTGDLNIYGGNWHLANEEMLSARWNFPAMKSTTFGAMEPTTANSPPRYSPMRCAGSGTIIRLRSAPENVRSNWSWISSFRVRIGGWSPLNTPPPALPPTIRAKSFSPILPTAASIILIKQEKRLPL